MYSKPRNLYQTRNCRNEWKNNNNTIEQRAQKHKLANIWYHKIFVKIEFNVIELNIFTQKTYTHSERVARRTAEIGSAIEKNEPKLQPEKWLTTDFRFCLGPQKESCLRAPYEWRNGSATWTVYLIAKGLKKNTQ